MESIQENCQICGAKSLINQSFRRTDCNMEEIGNELTQGN